MGTLNLQAIILAVALIVTVILVIKYYQNIKKFLLEVRTELGKVSWSSRKELIDSTFVVIVATFAAGIFIGLVDVLLSKMLSLVYK